MTRTPLRMTKTDPHCLKLNWFSPLPPSSTAIADYSARVIAELSQCAEITVWVEQAVYDPDITQYATVKTYDLAHFPWTDLQKSDLNVYHIANNPEFHSGIWQISQACPGLVVLHDLKLQNLFLGIFPDGRQEQSIYLRLMSYYYGKTGVSLAESFWEGQINLEVLVDPCPLTDLAIAGARGVIIHNSLVAQQLSTQTSIPIQYIPLCYSFPKVPELTPRPSFQPLYRLITFGYLGSNRRLEQILKALKTLPQRRDFRWDIYGTLPNAAAFKHKIRQFRLEESVYLHGFVSDQTLHEALSQAHLAINLRYPSMGEASLSQLWIWGHALPSLVTDTEWYSSLPPDTVALVPPSSEISTLQRYFQEFHANPEAFRQMGQRGRAFLESEHSPANYAAKFLEIIPTIMTQPYRVFSNHPIRSYFAEKVEQEFPEISQNLWLDSNFTGVVEAIKFLTQEQ